MTGDENDGNDVNGGYDENGTNIVSWVVRICRKHENGDERPERDNPTSDVKR